MPQIIWYVALAVTNDGRVIRYRRDPATNTLVPCKGDER